MARGKYFVLSSRLNGLVLDVCGNSCEPGAKLITYEQKGAGENLNQLWYEHQPTGTIRSRLNDYCLDLSGSEFVMNPFSPGNGNQQWKIDGELIRNRNTPSLVMDIEGKNIFQGATIIAWQFHGGDNQTWQSFYDEPVYFNIISHLNDMVLDVNGENASPGTGVITWPLKGDGSSNQVWYENEDGCVCSKLNEFALDSSDSSIKLQPYNPENPNQCWVINENRIQNKINPNLVIDIRQGNRDRGAGLCAYQYHGGPNQLFTFNIV